MAKSRMAGTLAALLLAAPATALAAPPLTAEAAVERQREELLAAARIGCRRTGEEADETIVVCGRGGPDPNRIGYEPTPGQRVRLLPGEAPSGTAALDATTACLPPSPCGGGIDVFRAVGVLAKIGKHILGKDD